MEREIINRINSGDIQAFKMLFDTYASPLYRFLKQFSTDSDLVEDWVQNAFIKAFRNIDRFEFKSNFSTWLFRIGINEMKSDYRKSKKYNSIPIEETLYEDPGTENRAFEWDMNMKWLLEELDDVKKSIFILFEVEGYSHSEIANILDISENNSRTTLSRTKQYLKHRWNSEMIKND